MMDSKCIKPCVEECVQHVGGEDWRYIKAQKNVGLDGTMILKWILKKKGGVRI
jgi:hypothetical protein